MGNEKYVYNIFGQTPNSNSQSLPPPRSLSLSFSINASYIWSTFGFQQFVSRYSQSPCLPEFLDWLCDHASAQCHGRTKNPWNGSPNICGRWPGPLWWSFLTTPLSWTRFALTSFSHFALNYLMISSLGCRWSETQGSYKAFCLCLVQPWLLALETLNCLLKAGRDTWHDALS